MSRTLVAMALWAVLGDIVASTLGSVLSGAPHELEELWGDHLKYEFDPAEKSTDKTMATMTSEPYVNHVPTLVGGVGKSLLRHFYQNHFIYTNPGMVITPVSRTIGSNQLVDEMVITVNHTSHIDWLVPGVHPTNRVIRFPLLAIVRFKYERDARWRLAHEHIYWDQAAVLTQLGQVSAKSAKGVELDISAAEQADLVLNLTSCPQCDAPSRAGPAVDMAGAPLVGSGTACDAAASQEAARKEEIENAWEAHLRPAPAAKSGGVPSEVPFVHYVPTSTAGFGRSALGRLLTRSHDAPAVDVARISRTVGSTQLVDEMVLTFNHTSHLSHLHGFAPSVPPTGRRVRLPVVVVVRFAPAPGAAAWRVVQERVYWDQASLLQQLGQLEASAFDGVLLDISGPEQAEKVLDPDAVPSNSMLVRTGRYTAPAEQPRGAAASTASARQSDL